MPPRACFSSLQTQEGPGDIFSFRFIFLPNQQTKYLPHLFTGSVSSVEEGFQLRAHRREHQTQPSYLCSSFPTTRLTIHAFILRSKSASILLLLNERSHEFDLETNFNKVRLMEMTDIGSHHSATEERERSNFQK